MRRRGVGVLILNSDGPADWARVGYAVSGVLHLLIGWIGVQVAWSASGKSADQSGALETLAGSTPGRLTLGQVHRDEPPSTCHRLHSVQAEVIQDHYHVMDVLCGPGRSTLSLDHAGSGATYVTRALGPGDATTAGGVC